MILKNPYAFFIKMFKPIHLILSGLVLYLIFLGNNILNVVNNYMYSSESFIDSAILEKTINNFIYIIPIIIIMFCLLLLSIMYKKNKPIVFYFINIFIFIVILVINIYTINFLKILTENAVSFKSVRLIHDLALINIVLESVSFLAFFVRGIGLNFKKLDFNSDISKLDINENDKAEFELNLNIDFNEKKRNRKNKFRNLKYLYLENKFIINIFIFVFITIVALLIVFIKIKSNDVNNEGEYYSTASFDFQVNNSILLNTNYKGEKITDDYIIVTNINIKSNYLEKKLYLNDFSLKIESMHFKPVKKYFDDLLDLGNFYNEEKLTSEYIDYLIAFEIPEKYIKDKMYFSYNSEGNIIDVLLQPKELDFKESIKSKKITEILELEEVLEGVSFKINNYDLKDKILIKYNYCIKKNDCILSKEYLRPSFDENYDKTILTLNIEYESSSELDVNNFYKLLFKFGSIQYKINDTWYSTHKFEEILSKRVKSNNNIYIGINSEIMKATEIKIVFNIRNLKYEYILKQEA